MQCALRGALRVRAVDLGRARTCYYICCAGMPLVGGGGGTVIVFVVGSGSGGASAWLRDAE